MRRKHRRLRRKEIRKQRRVIALSLIGVTFLFASGYAAFSTNLGINTKGNLVNYSRALATTYITNLYNNGDTTLIDDGTNDHNIRYSSKPVNNYVCLENEKTCNDDNLYRIIGVFNNIKTTENGIEETRIKLIKATELTKMKWDESGSNNWARPATLNTYLNSSSYKHYNNSLINNAIWNLGGGNNSKILTYQLYHIERGTTTNLNNESPATWIGKIALMYPSDYGYASKNCYNDVPVDDTNYEDYRQEKCINSNWLFGTANGINNYE